MSFATPILFLAFNRPEPTKQVLEIIKALQPNNFFIALDGPRTDVSNDGKRCTEVKEIIINTIDWDCNLHTLYRVENLGCGRAVSSAITWFFDQVSEGIILEDDCLPDKSFFTFCQELLVKYRHEENIMHIGGTNFQERHVGTASYFFSKYPHTWGWATWRRAWANFTLEPSDTESLASSLRKYETGDSEREYWKNEFDLLSRGKIDTWDYSWFSAIWKKGGLSIVPNNNLILNIGIGKDSTHTSTFFDDYRHFQLRPIGEIVHPEKIEINQNADQFTFSHFIDPQPSLSARFFAHASSMVPTSVREVLKKLKAAIVK